MDLSQLPRQLEAIQYAAGKLGANLREVDERLTSIHLAAQPGDAAAVREHVIELRGELPWHLLGTATFLDVQLERLIDMLASPAERAELAELAAR